MSKYLKTKLLRCKRGFSLIEVLVATSIISVIGLGVASVISINSKSTKQQQAVMTAMLAREKIEAALKNQASWAKTLQANSSLSCLLSASGCSLPVGNGGYQNFVVYGADSTEKLSYDSSDITSKLTLSGDHCSSNETNLDNCPIWFEAQWKPICAAYPCQDASVDIQVYLRTYLNNIAVTLNSDLYQFSTLISSGQTGKQAACVSLGGTYNAINQTCYPKYAGKTCASLGLPNQILKAVTINGDIQCGTLYHGSCNIPTEVVSGFLADGSVTCKPKVTGGICPVNCVGAWGACSAACGGGTQTYTITTPAANGGLPCANANGATQACNTNACPVNCVGAWGACNVACGGGTQVFTVTTPPANGGTACIANNGDTQACNTGACNLAVDCDGYWNACNPATGLQSFTITQAPQNGGLACPASPKTCAVDCQGSWSVCNAGSRTYTWSYPPLNGGLACPYANGTTDTAACITAVCGSADGTTAAVVPGAASLCNVGSPTNQFDQLINGGSSIYVMHQWQCMVSGSDFKWCSMNGLGCPSTVAWNSGPNSCSGSFDFTVGPIGNQTAHFTDNIAPETGTALYTCSMNGTLSSAAAPICDPPFLACNKMPINTTVNWYLGGDCSGPAPAQFTGAGTVPHGSIDLVWDTVADPRVGRATLQCVNGAWQINNVIAMTCYIP